MDYNFEIDYQPEKANVEADALNRKPLTKLRVMFARLSLHDDGSLLADLQVKSSLIEEIKTKQPTSNNIKFA